MNEIIKRDDLAPAGAAGLGFAELVRRFLASLDRRESSKSTYARALKQFGRWIETVPPAGPLTRENVLDYKRALIGRKLSPFTVNCYLTAVKRFFAWSEGAGLYPDIAKGIEPMRRGHNFRKDAFTPAQARELLNAVKVRTVKGKRDFAIINLMMRTGLRTIEIRRADVGDIANRGDQTVLYIQGKGRDEKSEFVLLTPATLAPIKSYLKTRDAFAQDAPLFAAISNRNRNGRMTTRSVSRLAKTAINRIAPGNNRLTAHSLRHSAVTFALLGGATVQEAQAFARHADINTTLIYAHNIDRIGAAPEIKIDALLRG